jgi:hypothetical protein
LSHSWNISKRICQSNTNPTKNRDELRYFGWVSNSCSISCTRRVTLDTNSVISHEWGKDWESACIWSIYISFDPKACCSYEDFSDRGLLITMKRLNQGFLLVKLKSSFQKCYGRHHDLVNRYGIYVSQMTTNMFHLSKTLSQSQVLLQCCYILMESSQWENYNHLFCRKLSFLCSHCQLWV